MDIESSKENLIEFKKLVNVPIYEISAINSEGLDKVLMKFADMLENVEDDPIYKESEFESHVLYKFKKERPYTITKDGNAWIIRGDEIEKLFKMTKFSSNDATVRFAKKLKSMGIDDKLKELGATDGDVVRILSYEFTYVE
jgi:GTP-binding protein